MRFKKTIVTLARHGLIVNNVVGDGAVENRSAMKSLGTLSIEDVLECHLTDNLRRLLPMDMKITFPHLIRSDVLLVIGGNMPHLVKKFVNGLERSDENDSTN